MEYLAVLGRLAKLSLAELEAQIGGEVVFCEVSAEGRGLGMGREMGETRGGGGGLARFVSETEPNISDFGGVMKFGAKILGGREGALEWLNGLPEGKITLGVSDYTGKRAGAEALGLKRELKRAGRSVRVLENKEAVLSTATSHHNQLAEKQNHVEIIITKFGWFRLTGVQNITKYAKRDQARPARDARVGMLPPKLAQMLINLCGELEPGVRVLDPFCGTGVVLQEAFLKGLLPYGTDIEPRMVEYSRRNLEWIGCKEYVVEDGDARTHIWGDTPEVKAVAAEVFLGQPMSKIPGEVRLREEKQRCREIILGFLKNLAGQVRPGTPVCLAIPAWLREEKMLSAGENSESFFGKYPGEISEGERKEGCRYERLGVLDEVERLGYNVRKFRNLSQEDLLYFRKGQVVAREIIVLRKK